MMKHLACPRVNIGTTLFTFDIFVSSLVIGTRSPYRATKAVMTCGCSIFIFLTGEHGVCESIIGVQLGQENSNPRVPVDR